MLGAYLDFHRATVLAKLTGLDDDVLHRPVAPTTLAPLGLLRHLTFGERYWFSYVFAGDDVDVPQAAGDQDREWRVGPEESAAGLRAEYEEQVVRSRAVLAAHSLDDLAARPPDGQPHSLRFVLVHVLEETARRWTERTGNERGLQTHDPSVVAQDARADVGPAPQGQPRSRPRRSPVSGSGETSLPRWRGCG